jgi:hypothetical protein
VNNTGCSSEYDPILSQPLLSITLVPEAVEILTIAPFHSVGSIKIASLGLIDKYAGLAAVKNSKVIGNMLSTDVVFDGTLGFLISSDMKDLEGNINVTVDGNSQAFSVVRKGGSLNLVQVDLTEAQACQGKTSWVIEVALV